MREPRSQNADFQSSVRSCELRGNDLPPAQFGHCRDLTDRGGNPGPRFSQQLQVRARGLEARTGSSSRWAPPSPTDSQHVTRPVS